MFYKTPALLSVGAASVSAIVFGGFGGAIGFSAETAAAERLKLSQTICRSLPISPPRPLQAPPDPAWSQNSVKLSFQQDVRVEEKWKDVQDDVVSSVAYSPGTGEFLASGSILVLKAGNTKNTIDGIIKIWKNVTLASVNRSAFERDDSGVSSVAFSPDGRFLAVGGVDGAVRLWDFSQWKSRGELFPKETGRATQQRSLAIAFSPDSRWLISAGVSPVGRVVARWDLQSDKPQPRPFVSGLGKRVDSVSFSPSSKVIAGTEEKAITLWSADSGARICRVGTDASGSWSIVTVVFSPDGKFMVGGSTDGTIRIWSTQNFQLPPTLVKGHTARTSTIVFSPTGQFFVSTGSDGVVNLWQVGKSEPVYQDASPKKEVTSASFRPDGKAFVTASSDKVIRLYEFFK